MENNKKYILKSVETSELMKTYELWVLYKTQNFTYNGSWPGGRDLKKKHKINILINYYSFINSITLSFGIFMYISLTSIVKFDKVTKLIKENRMSVYQYKNQIVKIIEILMKKNYFRFNKV